MSNDLAITQIDFNGTFLKQFDLMIPKKYKNNKDLWVTVRDHYLSETTKNKELYDTALKEYLRLQELKNNNITIMSDRDLFSDCVNQMAQVISNQKKLYSNFLKYISSLLEDKFDIKSNFTLQSSRTRGSRTRNSKTITK